ncbi:MAG: hypothetical protein D4R98_01195, partial [Comamonadaceae bacterium]
AHASQTEETTPRCGILVRTSGQSPALLTCDAVLRPFNALDLEPWIALKHGEDDAGPFLQLSLLSGPTQAWAPDFNTLHICQTLHLDTASSHHDLLREIVITLLLGPQCVEFPSLQEWRSAVKIRANIVVAARKTQLAFNTHALDRPLDCWRYDEDLGFILLPEVYLITALTKATQPAVSGSLFAFSCYRATEYVILLGIAQELVHCNPGLLAQIQDLWRTGPIVSGAFHSVFLQEHGSMEAPLPATYFVPGDRVWFRNPDATSSEASGFEGSWVVYLGDGLFSNFWKHQQPYSLAQKCVEIYHWRHGLYIDSDGEERIDEDRIAPQIEACLQNPAELAPLLEKMQRFREARGVYTEAGGCMDTTREFSRWVCPGTSDIVLPVR